MADPPTIGPSPPARASASRHNKEPPPSPVPDGKRSDAVESYENGAGGGGIVGAGS